MIDRAHEAGGIRSRALYSECGAYRYLLSRDWAGGGRLCYVLLNPSTATEAANDPTIERCQRRAVRLGYGGFDVVNLFAYRATHPHVLKAAPVPVGPENDAVVAQVARQADRVLCGWGVHGDHQARGAEVARDLAAEGIGLFHLGLTKGGAPRHPLYVSYDTDIRPWIERDEP